MMRRLLFGFILAVMAVSAVAQMLMQPSAESDFNPVKMLEISLNVIEAFDGKESGNYATALNGLANCN